MRPNNAEQINVVMTKEEKEALKRFCDETGLSLNAAMNKARDLLLVDSLRTKAPDSAANIEDFELAIGKILTLYKSAIDRSLTAREAAEKDVKGQLDAMATLAETNKVLQAEIQIKTEETAKWKTETANLEKRITELEKALKEAEDTKNNISELKKAITDLKEQNAVITQEKAKLVEKHNLEIAKLQNENFEKILKVVKAGK